MEEPESGYPLCYVPLLVVWLPRREHALRLTALRQAECAINYDAVH